MKYGITTEQLSEMVLEIESAESELKDKLAAMRTKGVIDYDDEIPLKLVMGLIYVSFNDVKIDEDLRLKLLTLLVKMTGGLPDIEHLFTYRGKWYVSIKGLELVDRLLSSENFKKTTDESPIIKTYIIYDTANNAYKIGRSIDPVHRLKSLRCGNPSIILFAECNSDVENELHKYFSDHNIGGEWFSLSKSDLNYIISEYGFTINKSGGNSTLN